MKKLLVLVLVVGGGYFLWQKYSGSGGPLKIEHPVYGEIRVTAETQGREVEMALFIRAADEADCHGRARESWNGALAGCPGCKMQHEEKCHAELPARYAKLFDDVPIPSTYLSATAGNRFERDGRLVVYGLTDAEGKMLCDMLRDAILKQYHGMAHCVAASGG
jgi:hypothetical protein